MEKPSDTIINCEEKTEDGVRYRRTFSGYTLRQFFSHSTSEKGPGPGWDNRWEILKKYAVDDPSLLPNDDYYTWEEISELDPPREQTP
jgi:hypothetical protein